MSRRSTAARSCTRQVFLCSVAVLAISAASRAHAQNASPQRATFESSPPQATGARTTSDQITSAQGAQPAHDAPAPGQSDAGAPTSTAAATQPGTELGEVVVTARRREESGQRVPQTVTALTPQLLKQQNIQSVADLTYAAPSLSVASSYTSLNSNFTVRGLPTGVTTYFADAPCCGAAAN